MDIKNKYIGTVFEDVVAQKEPAESEKAVAN